VLRQFMREPRVNEIIENDLAQGQKAKGGKNSKD
jgi:hypothetical protein